MSVLFRWGSDWWWWLLCAIANGILFTSLLCACAQNCCRSFLLTRVILFAKLFHFSDADSHDNEKIGLSCVTSKVIWWSCECQSLDGKWSWGTQLAFQTPDFIYGTNKKSCLHGYDILHLWSLRNKHGQEASFEILNSKYKTHGRHIL